MSPTSVSAASARSSADEMSVEVSARAACRRPLGRWFGRARRRAQAGGRSRRPVITRINNGSRKKPAGAMPVKRFARPSYRARASRPLSSGRAVPFAREPYNQRRKPAAPTPWGAAGSAEPKRRARKGLLALGPSSSRPRPRCHRRAPGPPSHEANERAHRQRLSRERPRGLRPGVELFGVLGLSQRARRPYARPLAGMERNTLKCFVQ
jgi:hypothetical protein